MLPNAIKRIFQAHKIKIATSILTVIVLGLATFFAYTAYASGEKALTLIENGHKVSITTRANTVEELFEEQNIKVDKQHDAIKPGLYTSLEDNMTVKLKSAHEITLTTDGDTKTIWTTATTVKDFLSEQNIEIGKHDVINASLGDKINESMDIAVNTAVHITVLDGKEKQELWPTEKTVGQLIDHLIDKGTIEKLGKYDKLLPKDRNQVLKQNDEVQVIRVTKQTVTKTETVDYDEVKQNDDSLDKGKTKVIQSGQKGEVKKIYTITQTTDQKGTTKKKDLVKKEVTKEPKKRIVAVGTKVVHHTSRSSRSLAGSSDKVMYVHSTAFTADCKGCNGITSLGINLKTHPNSKIIAVDPSIIPLGSKVWVEGYGYAIAGDTGGGISGRKIDVFFPSKSRAHSWGSRTVKIRVLN